MLWSNRRRHSKQQLVLLRGVDIQRLSSFTQPRGNVLHQNQAQSINFVCSFLGSSRLIDVVGARAAAQAQNTRGVSPLSLKARRLHNSRRELVAACEATSTTWLILFRALVEALGGLDPCRNGRKMCRKHGLNMGVSRAKKKSVTQVLQEKSLRKVLGGWGAIGAV